MKLELKHLAPYLPYSLKLIVSSVDGSDYELLTGLISQNGQSIAQISNTDYYLDDVEENDFSIAPILRPISDLKKNEFPFELGTYTEDFKFYLKDTEYQFIEKMLELHFDVFGLIEKELAIDINSLPQS